MKQELFIIATRGRGNKEIYLAVDESKNYKDKVYFKWTEDIDEAYATFEYSDIEYTAKHYFKNYNKWYITTHNYSFSDSKEDEDFDFLTELIKWGKEKKGDEIYDL